MRRSVAAFVCAMLFWPAVAVAQDSTAGRPDRPPSCAAPEYRHFDFWIGDWDVTDASGAPAGRNQIEPSLGGCALFEHWMGVDGVSGRSVNIYDARRSTWHQTWVDDRGNLLVLEGTAEPDGSVVMTGTRPARDGTLITHRIRWSLQADGTVRQHWQASRNGGQTWDDFFDGTYRKRR